MMKKTIKIEGMHCASCAGNVEKSLMVVKGVKSAKASILFNKAEIEADENVNIDDVKKAVSKFGFKVKDIK